MASLIVPSLAAVHCGGAAALLNPIYTGSEVEHALSVAQPRVVFTSPLSLDTLRNAEGGDKEAREKKTCIIRP